MTYVPCVPYYRSYGRGTSDNKGPILAFIYAVRELLEACTRAGRQLPINVAFFLEGEEENGSLGSKEVRAALAVLTRLRFR